MSVSRDREKRKVRFANTKEAAQKQDTGFTPTSFRVPEGLRQFRFKAKDHTYRLDVMAYIVGPGNRQADEGVAYYTLVYPIHKGLGPDRSNYTCMHTWNGEACYVCEYRARREAKGRLSKDEWKWLAPKENAIFLVIDLDDPELDREKPWASVQVFETAFYMMFGELLHDRIKALRDDDDRVEFWHPEHGMTLEVAVKEASREGGRPFGKPSVIDFVARKRQYDMDILHKMPCLETDVVAPAPYEKVKQLFLMNPDASDAKEQENGRAAPSSRKRDEEEEDERPAATSRRSRDEEDDDEDDSDLEPTSRRGDAAPARSRRRDEDDSDLEPAPSRKRDGEDERPAARPAPGKGGGKKDPTAQDLKLSVGDYVEYKKKECEIKKISSDGTSLLLEDDDGKRYNAVAPGEISVLPTADGPPATRAEDGEDDEDDDSDLEPRRPAAKTQSRKRDEEEDEPEDGGSPLEEPKRKPRTSRR